jgi:hypothetical protein
MFSLFAPKLPIDGDELEWQLATFKWLAAEFGPAGESPLVLPTAEYFPPSQCRGEGRIEDLFASVKAAAGMSDWPCELRAGAGDRPAHVGAGLLLRHEGAGAPCGTFTLDDGEGGRTVVITYNPSLADDIGALVATFAHELGHYLMSTAATAPPGGWELHELHTDLAAVHLGFGIFLANSARSFSQYQSAGETGWSARTQGYLSEGALVTAIAVFQRLAERDPMDAAPWLKEYLRSDLKKAARALDRLHPDIAASVAAVDLGDFVGG